MFKILEKFNNRFKLVNKSNFNYECSFMWTVLVWVFISAAAVSFYALIGLFLLMFLIQVNSVGFLGVALWGIKVADLPSLEIRVVATLALDILIVGFIFLAVSKRENNPLDVWGEWVAGSLYKGVIHLGLFHQKLLNKYCKRIER